MIFVGTLSQTGTALEPFIVWKDITTTFQTFILMIHILQVSWIGDSPAINNVDDILWSL